MVNTAEVIPPAFQNRVVRILKDPKAEWPVIEPEQTTTEKIYKEYIGLLAAIPAIATFIGYSIIGIPSPFGGGAMRISLVQGIVTMILTYVLTLAGVYVAALVIDKLAPTFESTSNEMQALKLVAYANTAAWVAGILNIIPVLGVLAILGSLYSVYLLYLGLPVMMKTPEAKVIPYMVVSALVVIVVMIVAGVLAGTLAASAMIF